MKSLLRFLRPRITVSASALTQILASIACFLGAFVLPLSMPEFKGVTSKVLAVLGCLMLAIGLLNLFYGRHFAKVLSRLGKRSRVVVPREGIGYLAIMLALAVGALLGHRNMPLLVFGMMAGPFILNGAIVYQMLKGIKIKRLAPRRAVTGEFVGIEFEVSNEKRLLSTHMLELRDRITGDKLTGMGKDDEGAITFVRIPARKKRIGRYQVRFARRGIYTLGPARISSRFPIGIGERGQLFSGSDSILVHPQIGELLPRWARQQKELAETQHRQYARQGLFDDEFHRIREYRSDDNPRNIHWRSTARKGELMVREHHQSRHADSLLILDLPKSDDWPEEAIETAISLAATLCVQQTKSSSGGRYLLAIAADQPQVITSRSPKGFREDALDALAMCGPSSRANLDDVLAAIVSGHGMTTERMILITPRPDHAEAALNNATEMFISGYTDLAMQTSVVKADLETLTSIFRLDDVREHRDSERHDTPAISEKDRPTYSFTPGGAK